MELLSEDVPSSGDQVVTSEVQTPFSGSLSSAAIAERMEGFSRDKDAERSLRDLFASSKSITAKENLLLSLRSVVLSVQQTTSKIGPYLVARSKRELQSV